MCFKWIFSSIYFMKIWSSTVSIDIYIVLIEISSSKQYRTIQNQLSSKIIDSKKIITSIPETPTFSLSHIWNCVHTRSTRCDVCINRVSDHLEVQSTVIRSSDNNDWVHPLSHGVQIIFWWSWATIPENPISHHLWSKTESSPDQTDVMWMQGVSGGIYKDK